MTSVLAVVGLECFPAREILLTAILHILILLIMLFYPTVPEKRQKCLFLLKASNHVPTGSDWQSVEAVIENVEKGFSVLHGVGQSSGWQWQWKRKRSTGAAR